MFFLREGETLHLRAWEYNACRIMTALARIFEANGGRVKKETGGFVCNRIAEEAIQDYKGKLANYNRWLDDPDITPGRKAALEKARAGFAEKLAKVEAAPNGPVAVTQATHITAVLNGVYYYAEFDDIFLTPLQIIKTPVVNGEYSRDATLVDGKYYGYDCFVVPSAPQEKVEAVAREIFDSLVAADMTPKRIDRKRIRVQNTHDSRWHWEFKQWERYEPLNF